MKALVDTCVWSETLRRKNSATSTVSEELRSLILEHRVEIIGSIRQELLSGICEKPQFDKIKTQLSAFSDIPITSDDHVLAAQFFNLCRTKGVQGSNTDFLICAVAVRHKLSIYTTDKDFEHFHNHLPIVLHKPERTNQP